MLSIAAPTGTAQFNQDEINVCQVMDELYQIASSNETKDVICKQLFNKIILNFTILCQQENSQSSRMPAKLQEAIVIVAMVRNSGSHRICQYDLSPVLGDLKMKANSILRKAIERYEQHGLAHLIDSGVALYCNKTGKKIELNTMELELPADVKLAFFELLAVHDQVSLGFVDHSFYSVFNQYFGALLNMTELKTVELLKEGRSVFYIFSMFPQCRKDEYVPWDDKGLRYLGGLGIGGPIVSSQIKNGKLSIAQALANREDAINEIEAQLTERQKNDLIVPCDCVFKRPPVLVPFRQVVTQYPADPIRYVVDGSLSLEQYLDFVSWFNLVNPAIQKYVDNGKLSMEEAIGLLYYVPDSLDCDKALQKRIDCDEITLKQAIEQIENEYKAKLVD